MVFNKRNKRLLREPLSFALCLIIFAPALVTGQSGRRPPTPTQTGSRRTGISSPRSTNTPRPRPSPAVSPSPTQTPTSNLPPPPPPPPPSATTQSSTTGAIDDGEIVRINSNLVPLPASVIDEQGRAIVNLQLTDFELRIDGQLRTISDLNFAETPVSLVMLFDNSSSLIQAREFEKQSAVRFFRRVMRPIDQAAIYSVSTVPALEHNFTSNVNSLVAAIERFGRPEGATALFDAIIQAARHLRPQTTRKVIIIVSDGADTISDSTFDDALRAAQASDCQIFAVRTGLSENTNLRDLAAERRLEEFAAQTGGAVYVPRGLNDLDTAFTQIAADLAQQYVLSYYPTDEPRDGRFRQISLRVANRPGARVRTRRGYYAPQG
jgi:Ca-activated chloride channel homolog